MERITTIVLILFFVSAVLCASCTESGRVLVVLAVVTAILFIILMILLWKLKRYSE